MRILLEEAAGRRVRSATRRWLRDIIAKISLRSFQQQMNLRGFPRFLYGIAILLLGSVYVANTQQAPVVELTQQQIGERAVKLVLSRYKIDPENMVPKTHKPLPTDGKWAISKDAPAACPKTIEPCVRVLYRVPDLNVTCEWTVLLRGSDDADVVLDLNEDAARYLVGKSVSGHASPKKLSGDPPVYPSIARDHHIRGSVKVLAHIDTTGHVNKITVISGPDLLRDAAVNTVNSWVYEPLIVGPSAVSLVALITVSFGIVPN